MTETKPEQTTPAVEEPTQQPQKPSVEPQVETEKTNTEDQQQSQPQQQQPTPAATPVPATAPASAKEGGRETSDKILYVGSLHKSVSEDMLKDLFSVAGQIKTVKILNDKNKPGFNYAFVEYENNQAADMALNTLNGRSINNSEIKINWAFQSATITTNNNNENDPTFNIFVGDLSPDIDDEGLKQAFGKFESLKQAHVMWDMQTSRSRGYGFVTFGVHSDAESALQTMNGEWLNGRAIRCNWASHKQANNNNQMNQHNHNNNNHHQNNNGYRNNNGRHNNPNNNRQFRQFHNGNNNNLNNNNSNNLYSQQLINPGLGGGNNNNQFQPPPPLPQQPGSLPQMLPMNGNNNNNSRDSNNNSMNGNNNNNNNSNNSSANGNNTNNNHPQGNIPVMSPQTYDIVLRQTPSWQTTVYLGNIAHFTQQGDLIPLLQNFGFIIDFKFHPERGCAFVKYDSHERAAMAIVQLAGFNVNGRPLKCGWGKDRPPPQMGHQFGNFSRGGGGGNGGMNMNMNMNIHAPPPPPPPQMYNQGRP
ncbi:PUB1 [[Candida] subhashii]|uniref:PUB1 n=1 Tax=[Candida] subhashii TaxID=561895 RepID=A0A8J5QL24_9ASCO|nr:PUB1 [[Candida] subhashii]KAG7664093.1 PUB1 [[Candida] subhashii]